MLVNRQNSFTSRILISLTFSDGTETTSFAIETVLAATDATNFSSNSSFLDSDFVDFILGMEQGDGR
jgi:hypothetical protein